MPNKTCHVCGKTKPLSGFYRHSQARDGNSNRCKECTYTIVSQTKYGPAKLSEEDEKICTTLIKRYGNANLRRLILALSLAITSCASPENQALLANYQRGCALGDRNSCTLVPVQQQINSDEATKNALLGILIAPLAILAIGAAAAADSSDSCWTDRRGHWHC
jgi:hypothetical protein